MSKWEIEWREALLTFLRWAHITPGKRQSKTLILSTNVDQKSLKTEFSIAICRSNDDKWQSKTLFLSIFDPRPTIFKNVFDCRLPGMHMGVWEKVEEEFRWVICPIDKCINCQVNKPLSGTSTLHQVISLFTWFSRYLYYEHAQGWLGIWYTFKQDIGQ